MLFHHGELSGPEGSAGRAASRLTPQPRLRSDGIVVFTQHRLEDLSVCGETTGWPAQNGSGHFGRVPQLLGPDPGPMQFVVTRVPSQFAEFAAQGPPFDVDEIWEDARAGTPARTPSPRAVFWWSRNGGISLAACRRSRRFR